MKKDTGNKNLRDKRGGTNSDVRHLRMDKGEQRSREETQNNGLPRSKDGRCAHSHTQACTVTHAQGFVGNHSVCEKGTQTRNDIFQHSVDLDRNCDHCDNPPDRSTRDGILSSPPPERSDTDQRHEGTLPVHQSRVSAGVGTSWDEASFRPDSARVEGVTARSEAQDGPSSGGQAQLHHGRDQEGHQGGIEEHVCGSRDSFWEQGNGRRTAPGSSSVVGGIGHGRDSDHLRSPPGSNLRRSSGDSTVISRMGQRSGSGGVRTGMAIAAIGEVGCESGQSARTVAGGEALGGMFPGVHPDRRSFDARFGCKKSVSSQWVRLNYSRGSEKHFRDCPRK